MTDSILIVGGGVSGLHAATVCADAGAHVIVVEEGPIVGGQLAAKVGANESSGDGAYASATPSLEAIGARKNIDILTLSELTSLDGRPGNFEAVVTQHARFVTDTCTRCNHCRAACPVVLANEYDSGLTYRKAIYTPGINTLPEAYVIDIEHCLNTPPNYLPCDRCASVCDDDSIHFDLPLQTRHGYNVAAVIVATGVDSSDVSLLTELGYGAHPDVITSTELQRMLTSPGPTGGFATRLSNEAYPENALFVLDDLSLFGLSVVASQAHKLIEQGVSQVDILVLGYADSDAKLRVAALCADTNVDIHFGGMFRMVSPDGDAPELSYEDFDTGHHVSRCADLVVLWAEPGPAPGLADLADKCDFALLDSGFVAGGEEPTTTTREGIYAAGCAPGPCMLEQCLQSATDAAQAALDCVDARLLNSQSKVDEDVQPVSDAGQSDLRQRIERMLFALIETR